MRLFSLISCGLLPAFLLHADEVSLGAMGKMTGKIKSVSAQNEILLQSPLSENLLLLQCENIESIEFDAAEKTSSPTNNLLYLKNGDVLAANVESLDATQLTFKTPWAEKLQVARTAIDSLHFGTGENQVLYRGPNKDDWELSRSWRFDNGLVSQGWTPAHRKFDSFPERYILTFTVEWQGNVGFKCLFNSNSIDGNNDNNCYIMQFNSAGFELKRQSTGSKKYTTLVSYNDFDGEDFEDNKANIEIRVDRGNRVMQLLINDKLKRNNIIDPMETGPMPTGNIVSFTATAGNEDTQTVSNILLSSWGSSSAEARMEKRTESKRDVMFDIESNRSSGELKSITPGKELQVLFENPHDPSPKPLPASKIAVIYFSGEKPKKSEGLFLIKLQNHGSLHVNSFTLEEGVLQANHADLGELRIKVPMIEQITRLPQG